jgi:phosphoribosylformylglycinamidine cyclo-ligase
MTDPKNPPASYTYEHSGVSIAAGNALVKAIGPLAKSTARPGADADLAVSAASSIRARRA